MISPSSPGGAIWSGDAPSFITRTRWLIPALPAEPGFTGAVWLMVKV